MIADGVGLTDEVIVELNPGPEPAPVGQPPPIPPRPDSDIGGDAWEDYVVALGADRDQACGLTVAELIELADRIGG